MTQIFEFMTTIPSIPYMIIVLASRTDHLKIWANRGTDKVKVFCAFCLDYAIGEIVLTEESAHQTGQIARKRTQDEIRLYCQYNTFINQKNSFSQPFIREIVVFNLPKSQCLD